MSVVPEQTILLVEDDKSIALVITTALESEGFSVDRCESLAARDRLLESGNYSALLTDVKLIDGDGLEDLPAIRAARTALPVIVLSAQNTLDTAVRASDIGAFEYFPKPFDLEELTRTVMRAVGKRSTTEPIVGDTAEGLPLVGRSQAMQGVYRMITRVLRNDLTVLVLGESGTGKELVADAIHQLGHRKGGPFVAVNAAAIPADLIESELFGHEKGAFTGAVGQAIGKFEQANGGTLFLDEIGDMPIDAQTRLLRALQSGRIRRVGGRHEIVTNVRIVAATNRDLGPLIAAGRFREDLYYRLNVVPIELPPLRDRPDDISALSNHFLSNAVEEGLPRRQLSTCAVAALKRRIWPGNVRELRNAIFRLALMAREEVIGSVEVVQILGDVDKRFADNGPTGFERALSEWTRKNEPSSGSLYHSALAAFEKPLLTHALHQTGGNQLRAARLLGINRNTLRKKLAELSIDADSFTRRE